MNKPAQKIPAFIQYILSQWYPGMINSVLCVTYPCSWIYKCDMQVNHHTHFVVWSLDCVSLIWYHYLVTISYSNRSIVRQPKAPIWINSHQSGTIEYYRSPPVKMTLQYAERHVHAGATNDVIYLSKLTTARSVQIRVYNNVSANTSATHADKYTSVSRLIGDETIFCL